MAAFFNLVILDLTILVFPLILTHTCQEYFPPFAQKKLTHICLPTIAQKIFTHSFWLNLMMAAILNSAILNSAILDSAILHKTLTQTNSIWLKVIHSHSTWWWQPSWILPFWIQPFCTKLWLKLIQFASKSFILIQLDDGSHLEFCHARFIHFAQKKLPLFILTQLDDDSHLEFCHFGFSHFAQNSDSN